MKRIILLVLFVITLTVNVSSAEVITFDDLDGYLEGSNTNIGTIGDGYSGFNWTNMGYINTSTYYHETSGFCNGNVSGDYVAYNEYASTAAVDDSVFDFTGAYFTAAWRIGLTIEAVGFLDGLELYSDTITVSYNDVSPTWFDAQFSGIDQLIISSYGGSTVEGWLNGEHFAMDNFTYSIPEPSRTNPVPEPATLLLLSTGLFGIAGLRDKNKRSVNIK